MSPKGRGYGVTPVEVLRRLKESVANESQNAVAKKTGLALSVVQGLLKGDREPSSSTLNKLADFWGVSVAELLGFTSMDEILNPVFTKGSKEDVEYTLGLYCADNNKECLSERLSELVFRIVDMPESEGHELLDRLKNR